MRANGDLFAPDFKETPYWWDAAPHETCAPGPPPATADVVVVGSGFTGLNAAIDLARAGRSTAVFDAGDLGQGASKRTFGFVGMALRHGFRALTKRHGVAYAVEVYREARAAFDSVAERVRTERIDCHFNAGGRLILARSKRQFDDLADEYKTREAHLGTRFSLMTGAAVEDEIRSELYYGAALIPELASIHPGLYHAGLLARAKEAGVTLLPGTPVTRIEAEATGFKVVTPRGITRARDVLVATNGYSGPAVPWVERRMIPFDGHVIATEELTPAAMARILPKDRSVLDHAHHIMSIRRTPDQKRILFVWRTAARPTTARMMGARLLADAATIVPAIATVRLSHAWSGRCAASFDQWPHLTMHDGMHVAGGYCYAGIHMSTYLGRKAAARILGRPDGRTVFADRPFPTVPGYRGNPWFMPIVMKRYDLLDRWERR
ncbi:MAG: FAD-binding oxidoreductase [Alphaproteobacteria bacterium]